MEEKNRIESKAPIENFEDIEFESYDYLVVDFSAFFSDISQKLAYVLNNSNRVLISTTFHEECMQTRLVASLSRRKLFDLNNSRVPITGLTVASSKITNVNGRIDTYRLASSLCQQGKKLLVVADNSTLAENIFSNGIDCDIFDLSIESMLSKADLSLKTLWLENTMYATTETPKGPELYTATGSITLSSIFNDSGREALICNILGNELLFAKIYKSVSLTKEKISNVENLVEVGRDLGVSWAAFPLEVVYSDTGLSEPVGFTMRRLPEAMKTLDKIELFSGRNDDVLPKYSLVPFLFPYVLCLDIVSKINWMSTKGVLATDMNDGNFAVLQSDVFFMDVDSFACGSYVSDTIAQNNTTREFDFTQKQEIIQFATESLLILCFKLITLGVQPMYKGRFRFRTNRVNRQLDYKWNLIPKNLRDLFSKVFENNEVCRIGELANELAIAIRTLKENGIGSTLMREAVGEHIFMTRSDDLGQAFFCMMSLSADESNDLLYFNFNVDASLPIMVAADSNPNKLFFFYRNSDQTYSIAAFDGNSYKYLSAEKSPGGKITLHLVQNGQQNSAKWRIESLEAGNPGCLECVIGCEAYPSLVLEVDQHSSSLTLADRLNFPHASRQQFMLSICS
ncbi:MAG: hypothetical protein FWG10_02935 [Eubacteriaceae bacterium]|nr:hypothetical protein [Eubacteriaceae bacterium]